ncbi:MAG: transposase [Acidimicrobiales bacterium]
MLPAEERLPDGSYLSVLHEVIGHHRRRSDVVVRVVEHGLWGPGRKGTEERYRLLTTLLGLATAPAAELAALYSGRWRPETALSELKTHQRGPRVVLRSKRPAGVTQELYGYFCAHYAVRWLVRTVALGAGEDPGRLSFARSLRAPRRRAASQLGFSPSGA